MPSPESQLPQPNSLVAAHFTSAEKYMLQVGPELVTPQAVIGMKQEAHEGHPERNEDSIYSGVSADGKFTIAAVFDGVGGHDHGQEASQAARQVLHEKVTKGTFAGDTLEQLSATFDEMAEAVAVDVKRGSTGSVVLIGELDENGDADAFIASVGDSPIFLVRSDGAVAQLTTDDTLEQEMLSEYAKNPSRAMQNYKIETDAEYMQRAHASPNVISNGFGAGLYEGPSTLKKIRVRKGDKIVVASDGVTGDYAHQKLMPGESNEMAIAQLVLNNPQETPAQKAERLVQAAGSTANGRQPKIDDRSAVVVEVGRTSDRAPQLDKHALKPSYAERAGVVDGEFRVVRDGTVEDSSWRVAKIQKFQNKGETVVMYVIEKAGHGNATDRLFVKETEFKQWQSQKAQEDFDKQVSMQQNMLNKARQVLEGAPSVAVFKDSDKPSLPQTLPENERWWAQEKDKRHMIQGTDLYLGQSVIIPRGKNGDRFSQAQILRANFDPEIGRRDIVVRFDSVDPATGNLKGYRKSIPVNDLSELQRRYAAGEVSITE
ncbi:MAG TPA: PP2C family protein-serine/threonine phosphatase [Candidatus Saccharibacteria bacterium]|jgi:serine/threonine protein phosphatase PrpC|nr:PP2C family protein-serine/threonine phosphatase [Candidatus Saccharibacteria bacterium]HMT55450.1 PP2C family protein-serine/threonine phosphatase [Candidatus Saccharibacteria bacterium]